MIKAMRLTVSKIGRGHTSWRSGHNKTDYNSIYGMHFRSTHGAEHARKTWARTSHGKRLKTLRHSLAQEELRLKLTSCAGGRQNMPPPLQVTFDLLTLKVVSESRVTWVTSVPILVLLGLCSRLRSDVRDRRQTRIIAK